MQKFLSWVCALGLILSSSISFASSLINQEEHEKRCGVAFKEAGEYYFSPDDFSQKLLLTTSDEALAEHLANILPLAPEKVPVCITLDPEGLDGDPDGILPIIGIEISPTGVVVSNQ